MTLNKEGEKPKRSYNRKKQYQEAKKNLVRASFDHKETIPFENRKLFNFLDLMEMPTPLMFCELKQSECKLKCCSSLTEDSVNSCHISGNK